MHMQELISKIKQKKELSNVSDSFIMDIATKHTKNLDLKNLKKKEIKLLIKKIRAELRVSVGSFNLADKTLLSLIKSGRINEAIQSHKSTQERLETYPLLKSLIDTLAPKTILDIGCGLNPLVLANKSTFYYASDVNELYLSAITEFFKKENISGKSFYYDLKKIDSSLPKSDLCLILKVFDVLEKKGHKLAEKIISSIDTKNMIISFSTKTLSGKPMNHPQRGWIEQLLSRLGHTYEIKKSKNEIFYIVTLRKH